jgi:hypothetical protein
VQVIFRGLSPGARGTGLSSDLALDVRPVPVGLRDDLGGLLTVSTRTTRR